MEDRNRTNDARKRIGVTPEMMIGVKQISHILRAAHGGMTACIEALRGDDSAEAFQFIEKWDSISDSDHLVLKVEEICISSGLSTRRLVELITGSMMSQAADISKILVASAQPKVLEKTIQAATEDFPIMDNLGQVVGWKRGDLKAQDLFHRATGFVPTPKGASFNFNMNSGGAQLAASTASAEDDALPNDALPTADRFLLDLHSAIKPPQKALPEPPMNEAPLGAPDFDDDDLEIDGDI